MTATMREQEPIAVMSSSKLGEYTIVQEIAEGTFGKVKSKYFISYLDVPTYTQGLFASGRAYPHRS